MQGVLTICVKKTLLVLCNPCHCLVPEHSYHPQQNSVLIAPSVQRLLRSGAGTYELEKPAL